MAGPGYSVNDLLQAISKCKDIYDAFRGEYENAPARIQELVDTCQYLHDVLGNIKWMFGDNNYPQESAFAYKLRECEAFIDRYRHLKKDFQKAHGSRKDKWLKAWETAQYAFEDKNAEKLKAALSLEMQKLMLFVFVFALRRNAQPSAWTTTPATLGSQDAAFESIITQLRSIRYKYEREMSMQALEVPRQPNLVGLYDELGDVWRELCAGAGFTEQHLALPLPPERLLQTPSRNLNNMIINLTHRTAQPLWQQVPALPEVSREQPRRTEHTPPSSPGLPSPSTIGPISPSSAFSTGPRPSISASTSPTQTQPSRRPPSSIFLPPPGLENQVAAIVFPDLPKNRNQLLRLSQWHCEHTESKHKVVWNTESPKGRLEHSLPDGVFPDTLHSELGKPSHVTFPGSVPHELVFTREDQNQHPHHRVFIPEYVFMDTETRAQFQSDVRNKDLSCTFDTDIISTDLHPRDRGGWAVMRDLKVWRNRHTSQHTFSFCTVDNEHAEFPLLAFQRNQATGRRETLGRNEVLLESSSWRKHSSVASPRPDSGRKTSTWEKLIRKKSASSPGDADSPFPKPAGPKFIKIRFSRTEVWSAEQAATEFKHIFDAAYQADAAPPFQSHYELGGQASSSRAAATPPMPSPTQGPTTSLTGIVDAVELDPTQRPGELSGVPDPVELAPSYSPIELPGAAGAVALDMAVSPLEDEPPAMMDLPDAMPSISTFSPFQSPTSPARDRTPAELLFSRRYVDTPRMTR